MFLSFRNRIRMYPAFVNCTTFDWFSEWPEDALIEVADKYLEEMNLGSEEVIIYKYDPITYKNDFFFQDHI